MNIEAVVDTLNAAFANDPGAIHALIINRVPCNQALADHPTVQVDSSPVGTGTSVGALGLINAVTETLTGERIAIKFDDATRKLLGFCVYKP